MIIINTALTQWSGLLIIMSNSNYLSENTCSFIFHHPKVDWLKREETESSNQKLEGDVVLMTTCGYVGGMTSPSKIQIFQRYYLLTTGRGLKLSTLNIAYLTVSISVKKAFKLLS